MIIHFITPLYTTRPDSLSRKIFDKPKRVLVADFILEVDGKRLIIPKGFEYDMASIPRIFWFITPPSYDPAWRAAAVHDYLYEKLYHKYTKQHADELFYRIMLKDGASPFIAKVFYWSVSKFGKGGWK